MYSPYPSSQSKLSLGDTVQDYIVMSTSHEPSVRAQGVRRLLSASPAASEEERVSTQYGYFPGNLLATYRDQPSPVSQHASRIQRRSSSSPFMSNQHDCLILFLLSSVFQL